jgi:hypothetical protein
LIARDRGAGFLHNPDTTTLPVVGKLTPECALIYGDETIFGIPFDAEIVALMGIVVESRGRGAAIGGTLECDAERGAAFDAHRVPICIKPNDDVGTD